MIEGLQEEIQRICETHPALTGNIFYQEAPTDQAFPYATYFEVNTEPDDDTADEIDHIYIQFDFWGKKRKKAFTLYTQHKELMGSAKDQLSVSGYTITCVKHTIRGYEPNRTERPWHVISEYRIDVQKN